MEDGVYGRHPFSSSKRGMNMPPRKKEKKVIEKNEDVLEKTGPDKDFNERVYDYKVSEEETRLVEVKGIEFMAKFYKTNSGTHGIRVNLDNNGKLFLEFLLFCEEIKSARTDGEKEADLIAFTTFGKLDKGLDFFGEMGFYVFPYDSKSNKESPHIVFNKEKNSPEPMARVEDFVEYFRKKFRIEVRPKRGLFDSLEGLDLTDI